MLSQKKWGLWTGVIILFAGSYWVHQKLDFALASKAQAESPQNVIKSEEKVRQEMLEISRQLGVTCAECHDVQNFKTGDKKSFKLAQEHIKIVELLRTHGMDGRKQPEANCYLCHRGKLVPDYQEKDLEKK